MKLIFESHPRIRAVTKNGVVSEPGAHSMPVFLGDPVEDEVFGLPGGNYPKEVGGNGSGKRLHHFGSSRNSKHFGSYSHLDFASQSG